MGYKGQIGGGEREEEKCEGLRESPKERTSDKENVGIFDPRWS